MTQMLNVNYPSELLENQNRISNYLSLIGRSCKTENQIELKKIQVKLNLNENKWPKTNCQIAKIQTRSNENSPKWNQHRNKCEL